MRYAFDLKPSYGLFAYDFRYTVDVRSKVINSNDDPFLFSNRTKITFQTLARVPESSPQTDVGAFTIDDQQTVSVYWKSLERRLAHGPNLSYAIDVSNYDDNKLIYRKNQSGTTFSCILQTISKTDRWKVEIFSENVIGKTKVSSVLNVRMPGNRCVKPENLRKIHDRDSYTITWTVPDAISNTMIEDFTVFWCKQRSRSENDCEV